MSKIEYFKIIHKYIKPDSLAYSFYIPHVILVTAKAIKVGIRIGLSKDKLRFIEESAMLHDIGMIKTKDEEIGCFGDNPYLCHILEGQKILEKEGLPMHARVARSHIGVGITKEEIIDKKLPLPEEDFLPETLEEEIISYADLFFSKDPKIIWQEKNYERVVRDIEKHGKEKLEIVSKWHKNFSD